VLSAETVIPFNLTIVTAPGIWDVPMDGAFPPPLTANGQPSLTIVRKIVTTSLTEVGVTLQTGSTEACCCE